MDERAWPATLHPHRHILAEPAAGGWVLIREDSHDIASRELLARRYLTTAERSALAGLEPGTARRRLLRRVALKDAVRSWMWARGAGPLWPAQFTVDNAPGGRPFVVASLPASTPTSMPTKVSVAHSDGLAVAIVDDAGDVGIDVERIGSRPGGIDRAALTGREATLLARVAGAETPPAGTPHGESGDAHLRWLTRFWAAKQAAAKAAGTGLADEPRRFEVDRVSGSFLHVSVGGTGDNPSGGRWIAVDEIADTVRLSGGSRDATAGQYHYVVAWTSRFVEEAAAGQWEGIRV
jgi:phosphopantetheinyl transferase